MTAGKDGDAAGMVTITAPILVAESVLAVRATAPRGDEVGGAALLLQLEMRDAASISISGAKLSN